LRNALKAFHETLGEYTLQDLLVTRPLLEELFMSGAAPSKDARKPATS
jgi:hypothetical protein